MKLNSNALAMLMRCYRAIFARAYLKSLASGLALSAALAAPAYAALDVNDQDDLTQLVSGNESPTGYNDINANDSGGVINLAGELKFGEVSWDKGGDEIGEKNTSFTGFIATDLSSKDPITSASGTLNVAEGAKLTGSTFLTNDDQTSRTYLAAAGVYYGGTAGGFSTNINGTLNFGAGVAVSSMQLAAAVYNNENSEAPLSAAVSGTVNGTINFADSTEKQTKISDTLIHGLRLETDYKKDDLLPMNITGTGSIYIGQNVLIEKDDTTATEQDNTEATPPEAVEIAAAYSEVGGTLNGIVTVNGTVQNVPIKGATSMGGNITGTVTIGESGAVILAADEDINGAQGWGDIDTIQGTVTINGQYGEAAPTDEGLTKAGGSTGDINVVETVTFRNATANFTANQSKDIADKSYIGTVNLLQIGSTEGGDSNFTATSSSGSVGSATANIQGYTKIDTINLMHLSKGVYAGTLNGIVTVGENASVDTINGLVLDDGAEFSGKGVLVTQQYDVAGTVQTINILGSGNTVAAGGDQSAASAQKLTALLADDSETPANGLSAEGHQITLNLNGGTVNKLATGTNESVININTTGNAILGAMTGSGSFGTVVVDATNANGDDAAFTYNGDNGLKADVLQLVTGGKNIENAVSVTSGGISANTVRAGANLMTYTEYKSNNEKIELGNQVSANDEAVYYQNGNEQASLAEKKGITTVRHADANTKLLAEAVLGSAALLNQGSEFVAGSGLDAAEAAVKRAAGGNSAFGAVQGGYSEYETGSQVDLTSVTGIVGFAKGINLGSGLLTTAVYLDLGYGSSESHVAGRSADTDHTYYGLGAAVRYGLDNGFFIDGSVRGGRTETDFEGKLHGGNANYESDAMYFGAHVGTGYEFALSDTMSLTPYLRYTLTWMEDDEVTVSDGSRFEIDSVTAHGIQAGADFDVKLSELMTFKAGLGYIGVWNGDADTQIRDFSLETPTLEGNSGVVKVGLHIAPPNSGFSCDLGAYGYAGDRKGGAGSLMVNYAF